MATYCSEIFPGSRLYHAFRLSSSFCTRESAPDASFPWSERHLRCVWADPAIRPTPLFSADGRVVIVENPGRWNLEAGPDFLDADLRTAPDQSITRGDIELHIRPADWRHHGHAGDRRYGRVIAHVTYFEGTLPPTDLPPSVLQIALRQPLRQIPSFSFDSLDLPAYPFATLAPAPPCAMGLKTWTPEQRMELLESAGEERLRLKSDRIAGAFADGNKEQVLYEEIMGALGYKQNRIPFLKLARRLPLDRLRLESAGNPALAFALLAGVAGLLPGKTNPLWDSETRRFVRLLWDFWWKHQATWRGQSLSREEWVLSNIRPVNQPLRRLMAASWLFVGTEAPIGSIIAACKAPDPSWRAIQEHLETTGSRTPWTWPSGLTGTGNPVPCALIGPGRAATILTNVIVPWAAATTGGKYDRAQLRILPVEDDNRHVRHTSHALFGRDHTPALYHSGLRQQGLLQIFHDFCLNSRNGCRDCGLPGLLAHQNQYAPAART